MFRLLAVEVDLAAWANLCQDKITIFFGQNGRFSYPFTLKIEWSNVPKREGRGNVDKQGRFLASAIVITGPKWAN